jgi:hypothetical protein
VLHLVVGNFGVVADSVSESSLKVEGWTIESALTVLSGLLTACEAAGFCRPRFALVIIDSSPFHSHCAIVRVSQVRSQA